MKNRFLLLLVVLVFLVRLFWIDLTVLESDMFRDFKVGQDIVDGNIKLMGVGDSDVQQSFGPVMHYLTAFSFFIYNDLLSPVILVAVLNSLAVIFTYLFCQKFFNQKVAVIASLLYAVNPWHVYLSHIFWNPNFLPFFSILFFYSLFRYVIDKIDYHLIIATGILTIMTHFHLTPLFFVPVLLISIFLYRKDTSKKYFVYSLLTVLIITLPYLYFNISHGLNLFGPLGYGAARGGESLVVNAAEVFGIPFMLATNYLGSYVYGTSDIFGKTSILFMLMTVVLILLFLISLIHLLFNLKEKKKSLLSLLFGVPIVLHLLRFGPMSPHYYFMLYPLQFIIMALFLVTIYDKYKKYFIPAFILILVLLLFNSYLLFNYVNENGATHGGEFSVPYKTKLEIFNYILKNDSNPTIILFKASNSFKFIFDNKYKGITYYELNGLSELKNVHGYLVIDRISYHKSKLTNKENLYFDSLSDKQIFGGVEIFKV